MIKLDAPARTVGGIDLLSDHEDPFVFYVMPPPPQIAVDETGAPVVTLLRFTQDGKITGGHLMLQVECKWPQDAIDAARAQLVTLLNDDKNRTSLRPLSVLSGSTAEVLFIGKDTASDGTISALLKHSYGTTSPKLDPPYTATFSALLTTDGVRLVEAALRQGAAPIACTYRLVTEALRPAMQIVATVDWKRTYQHFSSDFRMGYFFGVADIQNEVEKLTEDKSVVIRAVQGVASTDGAPAPDIGPALQWVQREIVEKVCEPSLPLSRTPAKSSLGDVGEIFDLGTQYTLKAVDQSEQTIAEIDLENETVVVRTLTLQTHLADILNGAPVDQHIADAPPDSPFFQRIQLHVATARPLAATFVKELDATFNYGTTTIPIVLNATTADGSASTWADKSIDRTWTLPLSATLTDDAPVEHAQAVQLQTQTGKQLELTLDLERLLGLWSIECRTKADDRVMLARVELQQMRAGQAVGDVNELGIDPSLGTATAWFRDYQQGDTIQATTHYLLKDGRLINLQPVTVDTRVYVLPPPFPTTMTVQIQAADDWDGIDHLIVAIQKNATMPTGTFQFNKPGDTFAVALDLPDATDRTYRYRISRFSTDNTETDDPDWKTSSVAFLMVGATPDDKVIVDVTPVGVELPQAGILAIEVELRYLDPVNQVRKIDTAVIRGLNDKFHWEVDIKDPTKKSYTYQVTTERMSGQKTVGAWTTATDRILFIPVTKA